MMHICLLTPSFLPVVDGGVPIASGRAATSLLRAGHQITALTVPSPEHPLNTTLLNILAGYDLARHYPELGNALLVCVTEVRTADQIDAYVAAMKSVLKKSKVA